MSEVAVMEQSISQKLIQRRLDRMRLGQATFDIFTLPSDPETSVALVPLSEAEYDQALASSALMDIPDSVSGNALRDRRGQEEILVRSMRNPNNIDEKIFSSTDQLRQALEVQDVNLLIDGYLELMEKISPRIDSLDDDEVEELKKVLETIPWKELTGGQWYALKRFLSTLTPEQLLGNLPGSFSTNP